MVSLLDERSKEPSERSPGIFDAASMFQVAAKVGTVLKNVIASHANVGQRTDATFNAPIILVGQIAGGEPR